MRQDRSAVPVPPRRPPSAVPTAPTVRIPPAAPTTVIRSGRRPPRSLLAALGITAAAAVLPGTGHLLLRRRRSGMILVGTAVLVVGAAAAFVLFVPRAELVEYLLTSRVLRTVIICCVLVAFAWVVVIVRTYLLARPPRLPAGQRAVGALAVLALCGAVTAPFGYAAYVTNTQRNLIEALFPNSSDTGAIEKPRINVFLVGSDAGPDRIGTRADTMVVANIDTRTGATVLFGLPRNIGYAQFPPGSPMARRFPTGFHDPSDPGNYLLNGVYAYGNEHPELAPTGPSGDPGLNLLHSSVAYMLGLDIDYYVTINMQGFASIIDALGGLDVDVGPKPIPMGGIGPSGEQVRPFGYIPSGRQHLSGDQALWFARSRTNSTDYARMGRQRCLIQYLVDQKSPTDVLRNFQSVAAATTSNVATNIPQSVLPALVTLAGKAKERSLGSISFDPNLPDPNEPNGRFDTGKPDVSYMRQVVRNAIDPDSATTAPAAPTRATTPGRKPSTSASPTPEPAGAGSPTPTSLEDACRAPATE